MRAFTPLKRILTWTNMSIMVITLSIGNVQAKETTVEVSDRQLMCLAQNIYHEAGMETFRGKVAVAQVTINRSENGNFPKTICGVVHQKTRVTVINENKPVVKTVCQFSWNCDAKNKIRYLSDAWKESLLVAEQVLYNQLRMDTLNEALYFHAVHINPHWGLERVARIGNHVFYSNDPAPKHQKSLDKRASK